MNNNTMLNYFRSLAEISGAKSTASVVQSFNESEMWAAPKNVARVTSELLMSE
jgi:hypothetical protein